MELVNTTPGVMTDIAMPSFVAAMKKAKNMRCRHSMMTHAIYGRRRNEERGKMTHSFYSVDEMFAAIEKFNRLQREYEEQTLAEIITKYDFIVGSKECKHRLMEVLPEGANIICSPYIESPTTVYAIKKFDTMDLLTEPCGAESEEA